MTTAPCEVCGQPTASKYGVCGGRDAGECSRELRRRRREAERAPYQACAVCGRATRSRVGVCQASAACRTEYHRRQYPEKIHRTRSTKPSRACEICGAPLRSDNIYGVCGRTAECQREKWRRYRQQPDRPCVYARGGCDGLAEPGKRECAAHIAAAEEKRDRRDRREELADQRRLALSPCAVCGQPTASMYGVCGSTAECKRERQRRGRDANREAVRHRNRERARQQRAANPKAPRPKVPRQQPTAESRAERAEVRRQTDRRWRAANRTAIREKDRRYLQRPDRPCRYATAGCAEYAVIGQRACEEHRRADDTRSRRRMRAKLSARLALRQGRACPWCASPLPTDLTDTHIDHVIPKSSGVVIEDEWNLQLLHAGCNQAKGSRITLQAIALAAEHGVTLRDFGAPARENHRRPAMIEGATSRRLIA